MINMGNNGEITNSTEIAQLKPSYIEQLKKLGEVYLIQRVTESLREMRGAIKTAVNTQDY